MFFGKLLPREGNFFALFDQHALFITQAADAFMQLLQNYEDAASREKHAAAVDEAEHAADRVTAEVVRMLHKTFITPIGREQILGLINAMDDIVDLLQDVTETLSLYDVRKLTEDIARLGDEEIDQLESDADRVLRSAMSRLFREEADVRELIKLKVIYEQLEAISDRCEDVANLIEGVVLENS
jgi:uncharacterized protein